MARPRALAAVALTALAAVAIAACGSDDGDDGGDNGGFTHVQAVDSGTCADAEYGGSGEPTELIVSDLPMQGDSAERSKQMVAAIRQELDDQNWRAGNVRLAFQACDDSIESTGEWDEATCKQNAEAYAADADVIGVIGTYNSGCAAAMIPILNKAPGGGLAMVSPGNTLICLTESAKGCEEGQPDSLYPTGKRNYARVVPNDAFQGAGLATFAQDQGVAKPYILYAGDDPTSKGLADTFRGAAESLGMDIAGFTAWDPEASDYAPLMNKVKAAGADGVVLAGLLEQHGPQLIKAKVAALGPNDTDVKLFAPDGFAQQATIDDTGPASAGMFVSVPGRTPDSLTGRGQAFVQQLRQDVGDAPVEHFAPYAGQAAEVLLSAIAPSPKRASVITGLLQAEVDKGIVGTFTITPTGDPSIGPISVSVARDTFITEDEITPPTSLVNAARGG